MITVEAASIPKPPPGRVKTDLKTLRVSIEKHGENFEKSYGKLTKLEAIRWAKFLDYNYHTLDKPLVKDEVYDILYDLITERWPNSKYLKSVGHRIKTPVTKKSAPRKGRKEVTLPVRMPSQNKIKAAGARLTKLAKAVRFIIGDKLDGISLLLEYKDGVPYGCYTRGDGQRGQDVSGVIPALNIPKTIPVKAPFYVRCEFIIKGRHFESKHSKHTGAGEFSNGRNMGGGLLTRNEPSSHVSDFDVVAYEIPKGKNAGAKLSTQLSTLKKLGFTVVRTKAVSSINADTLTELHDKFKRTAKYDIDGIIVTQDTSYIHSADNPKHAMAFKINSLANSLVVKVKGVEWNKSRHGSWRPRVIVDKVLLGGVEVQHFTGHSWYYIQNGFTSAEYKANIKSINNAHKRGATPPPALEPRPINVGSEIRVIRSGDVIPYIMEVVKPSKRGAEPDIDYILDEEQIHAISTKSEGRDDTQKKKSILHFFGKGGMDVEGLKSGTMDKLYEHGYNTIRKVMRLKFDQVMEIDGFKEKSASSLIYNIAKGVSENTFFARTGYASSIFGNKIGSSKLQAIIDFYPDIMHMVDLPTAQLESKFKEVQTISGSAAIIATRLPKFALFLEKHKITLLPEQAAEVIETVGNKLEGAKILLTGVRDPDLLKVIKSQGGGTASSVKSCTALITKPDYSNNKTDAAEELGIPVYTVESFKTKYKL